MSSGQMLIVLGVAVVTLVAVAALHRAGVPTSVVLVVAGLLIGFLPFVPDASLPPEVVLLGVLPLLVFDAAATASPTAFLREAPLIGLLAVVLVAATGFAVAAVAHWLAHVPWPMAFVLGTALGPTDASAATSIARRLGLPRRLRTILEGEALFNDVTALVLYTAAVTAATSGHFSAIHTAGTIAYAALAGAVIGLFAGTAGRWLRGLVDDPPIEIAGSILLAYAAYLPAEEIHASGVLAAVVAGVCWSWHRRNGAPSARSRLRSAAFWETLVFLLDMGLFVAVGLSLHSFTGEARGPIGRLVLGASAVVATVVGLRLLWMALGGRVVRRSGSGRSRSSGRTWRGRLLLGWAGMRGPITLAALLAAPAVGPGGDALVGRDDIIYIGFAVIIVTLVGQGMSLSPLVRRLGLTEPAGVAPPERLARLVLTRAALDHLVDASDRGEVEPDATDRLRAQFRARLRTLETGGGEDAEGLARSAAAELALRQELNALQRRRLLDLHAQRAIGTTTLRAVERELDLEEERLTQG